MSESILSRAASRYFRSLTLKQGIRDAQADIHILDEEEHRRIRQIERGVIFRAFLAGAFSATACALATLFTYDWLGPEPEHAGWLALLQHYSVVYGVTLIATLLELGFLYWDALRSVHALSCAAGLDLSWDRENKAVLHSLVDAALELPNPLQHEYVDPRRETPKWRILLVTLVYKAKVTVTNFILKVLVARLGGRIVARSWLDFFAVPVTAAWDAVVAAWVIREARIRAIGPATVTAWWHEILKDQKLCEDAGPTLLYRAAAAAIVKTSDLHPNHTFVLESIRRKFGQPAETEIDNASIFIAYFNAAPIRVQSLCLKVFLVTAVIDGRLAPGELRMWKILQASLKTPLTLPEPGILLSHFRQGKPLPPEFWDFLPEA